MKKKFIIAAIIGVVIIGGSTAVVALNNREAIKVQKEESVNNEEASKEVVKDKEENTNSDEILEEKDDNESKTEKLDNKSENNSDDNSFQSQSEINENPKEQTIDEGYEIFYKASDAYNREDFDEAVRLYETINNRDALAKVESAKDMFYLAKSISDEIDKGQKLYNSGEYIKAKMFMSKLIRGNYMTPKQEAKANEIYENAKAKVTPEEEKKVQQSFTYEKALEILKNNIGDDTKNNYKYSDEYIDEINGCKTIYINVTRENVESAEMYLVGSDGSVITGS
ncbi:hypothetical protein GNF80_11800 [Clostridium perfringens]|nr:hypothetical protein [Clostridium perfringens]